MLSIALLILASSVTMFGMYCRGAIFNRGVGVTESDNVLFYDTCDYYYRFNKRYGVVDPPVQLQEKRFDIARSLEMVTVVDKVPADLDKYTLRPAPTTTVFVKWNTDHVTLGSMCNWLIDCAGHYLSVESKGSSNRPRILAVMTDFVYRYAAAMEGKFRPNNKWAAPWGTNWYEFSITSTLMLFYFMLISQNQTDRLFAADLTLKIITTPTFSLGRARDNANMVYMALPWIVAHYLRHDAIKASRDPGYQKAVRYISFAMVQKRKDEGLYIDATYITHENVLAYGYLSEMTRMSLPLVGFDNLMRNFLLDWKKCQSIFGHRTIGYGCIGFHARDRRLTQFTVADSSYGVQVIPTCLFLRMYGENYAFSMRGQVPWIAYYEADATYKDMSQYWVQCRRVFFKDEKYTAAFPDIGFIYQKYYDETEKVEIKDRCVIPPDAKHTTTESFKCGPKRNTQPLNAGFVFAYGTVGMLRHFYNCPEMVYNIDLQRKPVKESVYGRMWVDEYVLCDYKQHTIDIWQKITKARTMPLILQADKPYLMDSDVPVGIFHMRWECQKKTLTHDFTRVDNPTIDLKSQYPKNIEVVNTNNTVMLLDHGKPKMAMYPDEWLDLNTSFVTTYNGKDYEFVYDSLTNQYWLAGICIDKA